MPNVSHTMDKTDEMFHGIMQAHQDLITKMHTMNKTPIDPGAFLDEYDSIAGSTLSFSLQVDRPALVQFILYSFTPVATATLTIGKASGKTRNIPIPATTTSVPGSIQCSMIIKPSEILTLNCPGATSMFLEVMGRVLSGTDWSQV